MSVRQMQGVIEFKMPIPTDLLPRLFQTTALKLRSNAANAEQSIALWYCSALSGKEIVANTAKT